MRSSARRRGHRIPFALPANLGGPTGFHHAIDNPESVRFGARSWWCDGTFGGPTFMDFVDERHPADIAFRVGLKGLPALLQLAETYVDLAMRPASLTLDAWAANLQAARERAVALTSPVSRPRSCRVSA